MKSMALGFRTWLAGGSVLAAVSLPAFGGAEKPADGTTGLRSIEGTCLFSGRPAAWSATLTPTGATSYAAVYVSSWDGRTLSYEGTIETDGKTTLSGTGKAVGGKGNGNFQFSGTYKDGTAQGTYREIGGRRSGTMTAGPLKDVVAQPADKATVAPADKTPAAAKPVAR